MLVDAIVIAVAPSLVMAGGVFVVGWVTRTPIRWWNLPQPMAISVVGSTLNCFGHWLVGGALCVAAGALGVRVALMPRASRYAKLVHLSYMSAILPLREPRWLWCRIWALGSLAMYWAQAGKDLDANAFRDTEDR